jgi:hypothetical protein
MILHILFTFLIISCILYTMYGPRKVKSSIDEKYYLVKNTEYSQEAADTLAKLNQKASILLKHLHNIKSSSIFKKNIELLSQRYSQDILGENILNHGTSYTINKGSYLGMCIVDKKNKIYDANTLMFVLLHELSHLGCESIGHTEEFIKFYQFILKESISLGIYDYSNYSKVSIEYCGISINSTPI